MASPVTQPNFYCLFLLVIQRPDFSAYIQVLMISHQDITSARFRADDAFISDMPAQANAA